MGGDRGEQTGTTTTINQSTQTATPTAQEIALQQLELERAQAAQQGMIGAQGAGLSLVNKLLTGTEPLPGFFQNLSQGLSESAISDISQSALKDLYPQFQGQGILDSGTAASVAGRTAGDIRRGAYEYNQQNLYNMLTTALTGQAQVQQPVLANQAMLGSQLAGLRTITNQGTTTTNYNQQQSTSPGLQSWLGTAGQGAAGAGGLLSGLAAAGFFCWVAAEIFDGWDKPKTCLVRYYIRELAPSWFRNFYMKYGERIAKFIHNKPILKLILRPLFEYFAYRGKVSLNLVGC